MSQPLEVDLFGDPVRRQDLSKAPGKRREAKPAGYGGIPGTGPAGETCGSCRHHYRNRLAKTYHKCILARFKWTGGRASDILVRSPACSKWERGEGHDG
jgi:hypothetical protein